MCFSRNFSHVFGFSKPTKPGAGQKEKGKEFVGHRAALLRMLEPSQGKDKNERRL
jgi:hypothetical protein